MNVPMFPVALTVHVAAGGVAVVTGAIAALARKRPGRHPRAGRWYLWALGVLFASAVVLAALRWPRDIHLLVLGAAAVGSGLTGYAMRRRRPRRWMRWHIVAMGASYALMLTAFYVDNGPRLPLWKLLPPWVFWILPAAVAAPLVVRALRRYGGYAVRPARRATRRTAAPPAPSRRTDRC